ncbi:hypothetical protein R3P38DRAFT_823755 [Favolaschia claudopus]|uniref:Uncharacterized protein n=1 Tax=Favolaschia claudopus TaxID=2862362 RepID=A0AAW0BXV5_9AGAR
MDSRASSVVSRGRSPTRQLRESRGSTSGWAEANRNPQPTQISLESLDAPDVDAGYGVGQRESSPAHQESHGNWYSSRPHERWEAPRAPAPHWGSQQYQPEPSHEEPLFVAVNPFERGRWRRNVRQTSADDHVPSRRRPSRPTQFAEYPTQHFTSGHFFEHPAQQYQPTQFPAQPSQWFPGPGAQHHSHIPPTMPQFVPAGQYAPRPPQPGYAYAPTPYFPAPESLPVFPPLPTAEDARPI